MNERGGQDDSGVPFRTNPSDLMEAVPAQLRKLPTISPRALGRGAFGTALKMPLGMLVFCVPVPAPRPSSGSSNVHPARQHVLASLPPPLETQIQFWALGFCWLTLASADIRGVNQ